MASVVASYLRAIVENIPSELNHRIKVMQSEEFEDFQEQTEGLIKEAIALRKSFYYRKKVFNENRGTQDDKVVAKFMLLIHDIAKFLVICDEEMERMLLSES